MEKPPRVIYSALSMQTALYRGFSPSGYHHHQASYTFSVMANLSGVYDSDEDKALLCLCSLCNDDSCGIQPTCCKCFETKPTVFKQKHILVPPLPYIEEAESLNSVHLPIHVFIQCDCVCVCVHACTSGNTFVFKWPFKCSSCHYNNINNCFYQVIWPDRL